jgi:tetratricopeptide (TPR) repeat protein
MERSAQELFLNGVEGLRSAGFVEWLVTECRKVTSRNPERALDLARLAVLASEGLDANSQALAAMRMGQVLRRCRGDYLGAETWFDRARQALEDEGSNPMLSAKLLRLRAFSLYSQRRSEEALPLVDQAITIYQVSGDADRLGKALVEKAAIVADVEGPRAAIQLAFRACGLIDFEESPRQAAVIAQNLSLYYADLGQVERAVSFLEIARDLLAEQGNAPADALRMDWSAGRILAEAGRYAESADVFKSTREGFVGLGLAAEAGQVSLDLSLSLLRLGRTRELREVAEEMLPIFRSRLLHKEALAAVSFFREAVIAETITASQIHAVSNFLVELESNSRARFRKPD